MTDEQRFLFDLQGYLVVPEVLDAATVSRMLAEMDARGVDPLPCGDIAHPSAGAAFRGAQKQV